MEKDKVGSNVKFSNELLWWRKKFWENMGEFLYKLGVKETFLPMIQIPEATKKINKLL